ncbi:conserved hypothetical protein [Vibrio chagasii]|nr:conserved hypothetical protein [Vibrio chagasii]CAH7257823.1 conserved hypothetical protein [Vibrio chagasii]CAH7349423.1 conserved hypothetical protein [Vibrio chagasii]CAH7407697.1 conserved hypothetical protein [Vibrio chagasii]
MGDITQTFSLLTNDASSHRLYCKQCRCLTLHSIACSFEERGTEECGGGHSVDWHNKNQIIQCLGCQDVSFRTVSTFSEDIEIDHEGPYHPEIIKYYPGRVEGVKSLESYLLPHTVQQIYQETVLSLENDQFILAGIGIRAIVETICKDLKAEGRDLYQKINTLKAKSIVTQEGADTLHKLRVLGNSSAHEVKAHDSRQLELALQIIEHMLEGTYIIPARVENVFPKTV